MNKLARALKRTTRRTHAAAPTPEVSRNKNFGDPAGLPLFLQRRSISAETSGTGTGPLDEAAEIAPIQTKLRVNQPGDAFEQEADGVSDQVMRMPGQRAESLGAALVQPSDTGQTAAPPIVHEVLRSPGQPLDPGTRAYMEPRFGCDLSQVRVHTDAAAQESAAVEGARAYTVGRDVVFGAGEYRPQTAVGRWVIGHELAHVIQQRESVPGGGAVERALEREAETAGVSVALGGNIRVSSAQQAPAVQFLRVSNGGFGRALEDFTNMFSVEDRAINLLRRSPSFMNLVKTLDKYYVSPTDFRGFVILSSSPRPTDRSKAYLGADGRLVQPAEVAGKRPLYFVVNSPSFEPFKAPANKFDGDIISLWIHDTPTFIQGLAHEATHAANFVGGAGPKPQTLVAEIEAGIKEEIAARESEATILGEIPDKAVKTKASEVGSREPREVQRDVSPAFHLTYLELFFFGRELREAKAAEKLDEEQAAQLRSKIDQHTGSYAAGLSQNSWARSEYGRIWFDQRTAKRDWRYFEKDNSREDATFVAKKEKLLQDHAKWFFHGKVFYLP